MIKLRVKELLKEKGISQKELAEKLNMTETGLSISINENGNPPLKRLEEIANALNVDFLELFIKNQNEDIPIYKKEDGKDIIVGFLKKIRILRETVFLCKMECLFLLKILYYEKNIYSFIPFSCYVRNSVYFMFFLR
ncbi:XRE family transcriptional regulator [Elizabethkingia bruuniana]|nr:helix-turn-helix transcriptional regulator [Elizabethkingia bruuniana]QDZ63238.1 XRE family transcriptional regulator [Elizabethkingia bruuniana]